MEGPVPADPSVLDNGAVASANPVATPEEPPAPPPTRATTSSRQPATRQPQTHQLLSASITNKPAGGPIAAPAQQPVTASPAPAPAVPANDLFSLDFHAPAQTQQSAGQQQPAKDVKQDIMSLFSTPTAQQPPAASNFGQWGATAPAPAQSSPWGAPQPQAVTTPPVSMMGQSGVGMWGASSGWSAPAQPAQSNLWGAPNNSTAQAGPNLFASGNDVWGAPAQAQAPDPFGSFASPASSTQKKDDAFGDLWGDFK